MLIEACAIGGKQRAALRRVGNVVCDGVRVARFSSDVAVHRRCTGRRYTGRGTRGRRVHWVMYVQAARCAQRGRKDVQEAHGFNTSRLRARRRRVVHVCEKFFLAIYGNR